MKANCRVNNIILTILMVYWGSNCYSQVTRLKIKDSISISGNRTYEILLNDHSLQDTNFTLSG